VIKLYLFYLRELHPNAFTGERADYFFSNRTRSVIFKMPSYIFGQIRQKAVAVGLNFFDFFCFVALQKKAALAPGSKPRGGGSAVSKGALFIGQTKSLPEGRQNGPPRGGGGGGFFLMWCA
jgi:hypothetical protein